MPALVAPGTGILLAAGAGVALEASDREDLAAETAVPAAREHVFVTPSSPEFMQSSHRIDPGPRFRT